MSSGTATRRRLIRRLIARETVTSQHQIVEHLEDAGHPVTQATVSRDLDALGAAKVRHGSHARYEIAHEERFAYRPTSDAVARAFSEFVESISYSGNLVVLHTLPGAAHLVAGAIDGAEIGGVLGTLAGDDTVFAVAVGPTGGAGLTKTLEHMGAG